MSENSTLFDAEGSAYLPLDEYAERAYLEYAMSVVKGRALPQVEDGQKPVQRRILYAMHEMGLSPNTKPVKSARVVGEILGKYHPHGDASAYDAMVRLAQDFTLRYPLIDGQGNFGSRDGDAAAAMRYTEARLTRYAELLLSELDLGTVDFTPNYDGAFEEPTLLPARLPMVLLNGASGIAVGMATEIPSHNLSEVAQALLCLLDQPDTSLEQLLQIIPGPDFPGGGQLIASAQDIQQAYSSGRGSLRLRARWEVEQLARGQWRIIVHELPPGTSAAKVLAEIEDATNPKIKAGKKVLSQDQQNLKNLMLSVLERVRDDSDQQQPVRLVLEPKSSRQTPDSLMSVLLAHTSLEGNVSLNLVMIGADGRPQQKNLLQILQEWLAFRWTTVTRRSQHRLNQVDQRIHILEGRMIAFLHIDAVIRVIREADEPKTELMQAFGLSEAQAEDILEIRLRQLARLEGFKLERDLAALRAEAEGLRHLLGDREAMRLQIRQEISADAAQYGDARRTLVAEASRTVLQQSVANEALTLILSRKGWARARVGHNLDLSLLNFKEGDELLQAIETRSVHPLVLLDHHGRSYSVTAGELPTGRGDGTPLTALIEVQDQGRILHACSSPPEARWLISSSGGYGFITRMEDMTSRLKAGKAFLTLEANEQPLAPCLLPAQPGPEGSNDWLAVLSEDGRLLVFALSELKELPRGRGLQLMQGSEALRQVCVFRHGLVIEGLGRGGKAGQMVLKGDSWQEYVQRRAKRGKALPTTWKQLQIKAWSPKSEG